MNNTNKPLTAEEAVLTEMEGFWNEAQQKVWMPKLVRLIEQQTAALREELERSKERKVMREELERMEELAQSITQERDDIHHSLLCLLEDVPDEKSAIERVIRQLEAVKKDREEFDSKMMELMIHHEKQLAEVTRQRDEAVKLLKEVVGIIDDQGASNFPTSMLSFSANVIETFIERLSSGETKPASPEILFYLLDNENPPYPEEDVLWYRKGEPPYAGSMLDENFPGLAYFYAFCNIPTPPDFLTDKK